MDVVDMARKPIRLGIIRCDTHGYYFGAQVGYRDILPDKLMEHDYIVEHYYQNIYDPFDLQKLPKVPGFEVVAVCVTADDTQTDWLTRHLHHIHSSSRS